MKYYMSFGYDKLENRNITYIWSDKTIEKASSIINNIDDIDNNDKHTIIKEAFELAEDNYKIIIF